MEHQVPQEVAEGRRRPPAPADRPDDLPEPEAEILKGQISVDHVHLFVSCPPHVSASYLVQRLKGKSSRNLMQEYSHLRKLCWGRHLWARGFFVASSGNVTDEVIMEYIRTLETTKDDDDFRVTEE